MIVVAGKALKAEISITLSAGFLSKRLTLNHNARKRRIIIRESMNTVYDEEEEVSSLFGH